MDTDWVIDYLHGRQPVVQYFDELVSEGIGLSIVSLAELYDGMQGGHAGAPTSVHMVDAEGNHESRNSKGPAFPVPDGYSVAYDVAGSGGYGNLAKRDPESIREDIVNGYMSAEKASEEHGADASGMVWGCGSWIECTLDEL